MVRKEKITRMSLLSKKIQGTASTTRELTKRIENRDSPDLADLVVEFNHVRWLNHVWMSNLYSDMEDLETTLLAKMTDTAKVSA